MANQETVERTSEAAEKATLAGQEKSDKTDESSLQDNVKDASVKVARTLKTGAQKVFHFTGGATKLSKLKVETHNLQTQVERMQLEAGRKLWEMHKENKLGKLDSTFEETFNKIDGLEKQIAAKESEAEAISLVE